jgi:glycosyltransferase involved in cell wall biosynthesis
VSRPASGDLLVSVVIDNFNYAEFLPGAIESALAQTHPRTEVVVVDDGSTDDSRAVIARYDGRVGAVLKENGGQGSAFNAGFAASRGAVVIFLDADDELEPDTAARVAARFAADPGLALVHYRLAIVDAAGRPTGGFIPAEHARLPEGDLRARSLRAPDDIPHASASGNAFARGALDRLLPMPEDERTAADRHLLNLAPLLGTVGALDGVGGSYRVHGRNAFHTAGLDLDRVRHTLHHTERTHRELGRLAAELGLVASPADARPRSVTDLAQRLASLRLDPPRHPIAGDRRLALALQGMGAALRRSDLPARGRLLYAGWFVAMAGAPRGVARRLVERLMSAWRTAGLGA